MDKVVIHFDVFFTNKFKVNLFLNQLENNLSNCINEEGSSQFSIESLIDSCFYFGLSMSRIGADFRPSLVPIFQKFFLKRFQQSIDRSIQKFEKLMDNYSISNSLVPVTTDYEKEIDQENFEPPAILAHYLPLGHLYNDILMCFNQVRKIVPLALVSQFRDCLNQCFHQISEILLNYYK